MHFIENQTEHMYKNPNTQEKKYIYTILNPFEKVKYDTFYFTSLVTTSSNCDAQDWMLLCYGVGFFYFYTVPFIGTGLILFWN